MSDPEDIRNWQRLSARITTSGRLQPGDPARLAGLGVRAIVNLALADHPEALADEAGECARAGLGYVHIPVPFDAPDDTHYAAFRAAIEADDAPIHVHCIMNFRVSAFFCRYQRDVLGMAAGQARAIMAHHWDPADHGHPDAPKWAAFLAPLKTGETA